MCRLGINLLTFDPEPGVAGDVAGLVGGAALEHAAVLAPHVVDVEGVVGQDGVADGGDVGEGNRVTVPEEKWVRRWKLWRKR